MNEGLLKGVKASRSRPQISHLLFADDCILFNEASSRGANLLKEILRKYRRCSGQRVNFDKSTQEYLRNLEELGGQNFGIRDIYRNEGRKFLSSPFCKPFQLTRWHVFFYPKHCVMSLKISSPNSGGKKDMGKRASTSESGGLRFRNMSQFNIAMLTKQGWRLINHPNSLLAKVLKAKYFPRSDFFNAQLGNSPSLTWRSIWAAKGLLHSGMGWRLGRGTGILLWDDYWIPRQEVE
ncbi:reverse transcriptase [Gossypium australe]|uniref:Reverse transcriptase n=1 Tax=Gossypium australe TaxID=47621 RepID=A0A5B6W4Z2_9ROSI|nr:reverse transcriptase [Gossypium australe]